PSVRSDNQPHLVCAASKFAELAERDGALWKHPRRVHIHDRRGRHGPVLLWIEAPHLQEIIGTSLESSDRRFERLGFDPHSPRQTFVEHEALYSGGRLRSEEHTSELQSRENLVCR